MRCLFFSSWFSPPEGDFFSWLSYNAEMKTFDEAYLTIMEAAAGFVPEGEPVPLDAAPGRFLAENLTAPEDLPMADNSAMDGYCFRRSDAVAAASESPVSLPLTTGIDAGHPLDSLPGGHAAYIATGGILPAGADTIVRIEDAELSSHGTHVLIRSLPPEGTYIRHRGRDRRAGDLVLTAGLRLTPYAVGVAASLGRTVVRVARRPRVCILVSGDEVVMPFDHPQPWQVRNTNTPILKALIRSAGGEPLDLGIVRDDLGSAEAALRRAAELGDVVVSSGGISMGRKDPFATALETVGAAVSIRGVAMKPGKPLTFGYIGKTPYFGLPGNQASSAVTAELFLRPFLARLQGSADPDHRRVHLPLSKEAANRTGRDDFQRGRLVNTASGPVAETLEKQDSHFLSSLLGADLLVRIPGERPQIKAGELVECRFIG
ncbi:molybdopterin molybdotransferase MoeA [Candidatus Ozemobacteraceae bacterium]|nr:molybdopterin molybdotransferase MoeA [Candidatus Ozemobacteraceae bacterium]